MRGQNRKSQAESIICETEMDHGPMWCLIPRVYVTESSRGDRTCAASALLSISLGCKKHIELVETRKSHDMLLVKLCGL